MPANRLLLPAVVFCGLMGTAIQAQEIRWRQDYNAARKEAQERNCPILLDFGTRDCFWCKKMDATTFRAPAVVALLNERFVPVKLDGERDRAITQALNIHAFPTFVLALHEGQVMAVHPGYLDVARLMALLQQTLATASAARPPDRTPSAQELLIQARGAYAARQYLRCLDCCELLTVGYSEVPEAAEAKHLLTEVKSQPEQLQQACDDLGERLASLYLELAESWLKKGRSEQATVYLQRVVQLLPGSPQATQARERLAVMLKQ